MATALRVRIPGITFVQELEGIAEYRLEKNGLQILLAPDAVQPVAGVMVTYRVGSRNEATGYTGATHLLEHLMFKGSRKFNRKNGKDMRDLLGAKGADANASTFYDRTNYYEIMPRELLPVALEMEADRMRYAFIDEKDRKSEMTVVRNEFEQLENRPYIVLDQLVFGLAFQSHPYHNPVIGWRDDIENVSIERLKRFYDDFYWPDNATLTVAGGFDVPSTLKLVKKLFGEHTRNPNPYPRMYTQEPPQEGQRRGTVKRSGSNMVCVAFKMPEASHPDLIPLTLLGFILTNGKTSRLNKALVEPGYATNEAGYWLNLRDPGLFQLFATIADSSSHREVEEIMLDEIRKIKEEKADARELDKAKIAIRVLRAQRRDGVYEFLDTLNEDIAAGDWTRFATLSEAFQKVSAADISRVARAYLVEDRSTVGWYMRAE